MTKKDLLDGYRLAMSVLRDRNSTQDEKDAAEGACILYVQALKEIKVNPASY
jgi:hypothetical protein